MADVEPGGDFTPGWPVGQLHQAGGGNVWVVGRFTALPWNPSERFQHEINDARSAAVALRSWSGQQPLSIGVHDPAVPGGELILCEVAVPPGANEPGPESATEQET